LLSYEIYDPRRQLNLANLNLSKTNNYFTLGINAPGLNRDLPFGSSEYRFAIRAIDENGKGVSSYAQVSIEVNDTNNRAPIPTVKFHSYNECLIFYFQCRIFHAFQKALIQRFP
jgi:hypothetical protein